MDKRVYRQVQRIAKETMSYAARHITAGMNLRDVRKMCEEKMLALVRNSGAKLRSYLNAVSEDYIDEISDTREDPDHVRRRAKKPRVISPLELGKLSANERIRYRYRQLLRQNPQWPKGSTPRENLKDAASVYEAVRYGEQTATDADARKFSEETKKK